MHSEVRRQINITWKCPVTSSGDNSYTNKTFRRFHVRPQPYESVIRYSPNFIYAIIALLLINTLLPILVMGFKDSESCIFHGLVTVLAILGALSASYVCSA